VDSLGALAVCFFGGGEPMDLAIDLWVDSLGALAVCFLYDEFSHD
jgi:hypothetical protein